MVTEIVHMIDKRNIVVESVIYGVLSKKEHAISISLIYG